MEDDLVHLFPSFITWPLAGMPSAATQPGCHRVALGQPTPTTGTMSCPHLLPAVIGQSDRASFAGSHEMLPIEYHFRGPPSLKGPGFQLTNEAVKKSMQLSVGTPGPNALFQWPPSVNESEPFPELDLPASPWTLRRPKLGIHEMVQGPLHSC
jgi:hypothetical protein